MENHCKQSHTHTDSDRATLSPLLFVLCIKKLSYMINESVHRKKWSPLKFCQSGPAVSHLFFADDLILMGKATKANTKEIHRVLDVFCQNSGLKLSPPKSKVFFCFSRTE